MACSFKTEKWGAVYRPKIGRQFENKSGRQFRNMKMAGS